MSCEKRIPGNLFYDVKEQPIETLTVNNGPTRTKIKVESAIKQPKTITNSVDTIYSEILTLIEE